mmetsp:Transcript_23888/g.66272  ORF Transcript_23888/g.66272 Transcript_23888/m.66272 type:complete len:182 (+) Transcript_23888:1241-1786(+)
MSGGVRNVSIHNLIIRNTPRALYIKSARGRGGYVQDVKYSNIQIIRSNQAIRVAEDYREVHPNQTAVPMVRNISFDHIEALQVDKAVTVIGLPDAVIQNFNGNHILFTISAEGRAAGDPYECHYAKGSWTYVTPRPSCEELLDMAQLSKDSKLPAAKGPRMIHASAFWGCGTGAARVDRCL